MIEGIESVLKILIVEDEDSKLAEWDAAISSHNADSANKGYWIEFVSAKTVSKAKRLLEQHSFDAAIIDLRLKVEGEAVENNDHGNNLISHILETHPLGIVVHTGQGGDAEIPAYATSQVKVLDKGDGLDPVFEWLENNRDVFLRLRGAKSIFNRETARMFFKSIWPRWKNWESADKEQLTHVVARHVIAHIHDSLLAASNDSTHPEETYFVPPLKERLDTGDLVRIENKVWIVVTPRCDMANTKKVKTIVLAACEDISAEWNSLMVPPVSGKTEEKIKKIIQHRGVHKEHFLFPLIDLEAQKHGPWMVCFDELMSVPAAEAAERFSAGRFASLSPLFVPSLVERLGAYFSRIGTPGFSSE